MKIADVEWIGAAQAEKLNAVGVVHDDDLLVRCATRAGRTRLADATGLRAEALLDIIRRLELLRIEGLLPEDVNLLMAAGVSGAADLAGRHPPHLAEALAELGRTRASVRQAPDAALVAAWVQAAGTAEVVED